MIHLTHAEHVAAAKAQSHWSAKQRNHLRRVLKAGATLAYWGSDRHGRPSNHEIKALGERRKWTARPGAVQIVEGPLLECSPRALHATWEPHRWRGDRVWLVALFGDLIRDESARKYAALHREIIGEILPEEALDPSVGARIGRKDLQSANLQSANLQSANLQSANLQSADLRSANLSNCCWPKSRTAPDGWTYDPPVADREWVLLRLAK